MLKEKRIFLFDIDGTLSIDTTVLEGTMELLHYIEEIGGHAFYITNNASKSRNDYVQKFKHMGIAATKEQFVTAGYASCLYMKQHYSGKKIFVVGTTSFVEELKDYGLDVTETYDKEAAAVLIGFDQELTYKKVKDACHLLFDKKVDYIGTNADLRCPTSFGFMPDCAGICQMLNVTTNREPFYIGKPNPDMVTLCLQMVNGTKEEALVVGDRLYTDIACGIHAGVDTAVVFTGEAKREDLKNTKYPPSYTFENIKELYETIQKERVQ